MVLLAGVTKIFRPLWALVRRNTLPSRVTGSFRTADRVLMILAPSGLKMPPILHQAAHRECEFTMCGLIGCDLDPVRSKIANLSNQAYCIAVHHTTYFNAQNLGPRFCRGPTLSSDALDLRFLRGLFHCAVRRRSHSKLPGKSLGNTDN